MQRHDNDTVERLWPGAADPTNLRFVPLELRDLVADIPADVEQKLRRELYTTKELMVTDGRRKAHTLNPSTDEHDLETCVVVQKNAWARRQLDNERTTSEQKARDAAQYRCPCCAEIVLPSALDADRHTQRRRLSDGSTAKVCGKCAVVAERLAVDRIAAEMIDGKTRADRVRTLIAGVTP